MQANGQDSGAFPAKNAVAHTERGKTGLNEKGRFIGGEASFGSYHAQGTTGLRKPVR